MKSAIKKEQDANGMTEQSVNIVWVELEPRTPQANNSRFYAGKRQRILPHAERASSER